MIPGAGLRSTVTGSPISGGPISISVIKGAPRQAPQ